MKIEQSKRDMFGCCNQHAGMLQRATIRETELDEVPPVVHDVLRAPGRALDDGTRRFMESRFEHDFSGVRVHTDPQAAESAQAVNARAYTVGRNMVLGAGEYTPHTPDGQRLVAHELTHVVQQDLAPSDTFTRLRIDNAHSAAEQHAAYMANTFDQEHQGSVMSFIPQANSVLPLMVQRVCSSASVCSAPVAGSAQAFGASETTRERSARSRRRGMSPRRQRSTGHVGHARQLEHFLQRESPGLLNNVHGIFIDQDMSSGTGAMVMNCSHMVPPITGATKPCVFVHGELNQQALAFNRTSARTIGRETREMWRIKTLQLLTHEISHVIFDTAAHATPAGITSGTCTRANISDELSELNAIMSEFPAAFRAIPAGASVNHPTRVHLRNWFRIVATGGVEDIQGALKKIGCSCECFEVDAFVRDTFNFVSRTWTAAEKTAFNAGMRSQFPAAGRPRWPL